MAAFRSLKDDPQDVPGGLARKQVALLSMSMGLYGVEVYTSGTHTGVYGVLHAIEESVVTVTRDGASAGPLTVAAGDRLYGRISGVTISSGTVELYLAPQ